jgi:hypothetical protein
MPVAFLADVPNIVVGGLLVTGVPAMLGAVKPGLRAWRQTGKMPQRAFWSLVGLVGVIAVVIGLAAINAKRTDDGNTVVGPKPPVGPESPDRTPPAALADLHATPGPGYVTLAWQPSPSPDVDHYELLRDGEPLARTAQLTYTDHPPADRVTSYRVAAVDHAGNRSSPVTVTATTAPQTAPAKGLHTFTNAETDNAELADHVDINGRQGLPDAATFDIGIAYDAGTVKVPTNKQFATMTALVGITAAAECPENHAAVAVQDQDGHVLWPPGGDDREVTSTNTPKLQIDVSEANQVVLAARSLSTSYSEHCNGAVDVAFAKVEFTPKPTAP